MNIHTITAYDNKEGFGTVVHRTADRHKHYSELRYLKKNVSTHTFGETEDDLDGCPECGLPLSEHGTTTEIDTLESCIERDFTGDL